MKKVDKWKMERELQKALTIEYVRHYCVEKKISIEKLKSEEFHWMYNECLFAHPSDIGQDGLKNDMETLPKVTLVIKHENDKLSIEQTEYTKEFLSVE